MKPSKNVYELFLVIGLLSALYLYVIAFDDFSETELVRLSYGWIAALIFGTHGLIGVELNEIVASGRAASFREALEVRRETKDRSIFSKAASVMLWSYLLITAASEHKRPFLSAVLATVIWIALLAFFLEAIFPSL